MGTKIEWTDETLNPLVGCTKCSPACRNCYAERMARRLKGMGFSQYQDVVDPDGFWTGEIGYNMAVLDKIKTWRKPRIVFMVSMGDLFHEHVPFPIISEIAEIMQAAPQHTFQLLTKRPERALEWWIWSGFSYKTLPNVWMGVTAENHEKFYERYYWLAQIPAAVRYVSMEPLLSGIEMGSATPDWIIVGGETGPGARPMDAQWARDMRDQCNAMGVPFFYKGAGTAHHSKSKWGYRLLDGREWNEMPEATR